jgi:predicted unusual protein kinase regulating ubiquinone biosynthesis (AarF/ABC1/UbiB family)
MTLISFNSVIFFMICLDKLSLGAVEPRVGIGDYNPKLSAEVKELKTTLASVQGSLITSVGLIQDQIDQFNKQLTSSVDSKLSVIEAKMIIFEDTLKRLDERSGGWDTVQHHVRTWGDQMTSLDSKVDHLGRSQMERLTTITGQVSSLQTSLGFNAERVSEQISSLEARLQRLITDSNPQIISSLQRLETKMASNRVRAKIPLHSRYIELL